MKNQGFTSFDMLTIIFSIAAVFMVVSPILKRRVKIQQINMAQREVENLARTLVTDRKLVLDTKKIGEMARSLASGVKSKSGDKVEDEKLDIGHFGNDPWGRPYSFLIVRDDKGEAITLVVWSDGPNQKQDTSWNKLKVAGVDLNFGEDDLGYVSVLD